MQSCRATNDHERLSLHFELRSMRTFLVLTFLLRPSTCATSNEMRFPTLASFFRICDSLLRMSRKSVTRSARLVILLEGTSERYLRGTKKKRRRQEIMKYGFIRQILNWISSNFVWFENDTRNGKSYRTFLACFRSAADRPRTLNKFYLSVYSYCGMCRLKYTHL